MATRELQPPTSRPPDGEGPKAGLTFAHRLGKGGGGLFACKGCRSTGGRANQTPLGDPLARTPPTDCPTPHPHHPPDWMATDWAPGHLRPSPTARLATYALPTPTPPDRLMGHPLAYPSPHRPLPFGAPTYTYRLAGERVGVI